MRPIEKRSPEHKEAIEARQRAELEGDDEYIVRTRADDRSILLRLGFVLEKWRPIIYLVGGALLALGFDFKTPAQSYKELQGKIEEVRADNVQLRDLHTALERRAEGDRDSLHRKLDALIVGRCLDPSSARDLAIARIDCRAYISTLRNGR